MGFRDISVWGYSAAALALLCAGGAIAWEYLVEFRYGLTQDMGDATTESYFNLHVLLMYWLYLLPNALGAISFRAFTFMERETAKLFHAFFNTIGFAASIAGFVLVYKHQQETYGEYGHFYSPHTYIGIITLALYWFQWIAGVFLYLIPWENYLSKDNMMRMGKLKGGFIQSHRAIGYVCFALIAVSCILGFITNYMYGFTKNDPNHDKDKVMPFMNQSLTLIFVGMMVLLLLIVNTKYVRPKPKDTYKPHETATLQTVVPDDKNVKEPTASF